MSRLQTTSCPLPCLHATAPTPFSVLDPFVNQIKTCFISSCEPPFHSLRSPIVTLYGFSKNYLFEHRSRTTRVCIPSCSTSSQSICPSCELWLCMRQFALKAIFLLHRSRGGKPEGFHRPPEESSSCTPLRPPAPSSESYTEPFWPPSTCNVATIQRPYIPVVGAEQPCTAI